MTLKGYAVLESMIAKGYAQLIESVVVGKDQSVDNDYSGEIIKLCQNGKIDFYLRKNAPESDAEFSLAISWRWLLDPKTNCLIVLHDSLLPSYRGFAPLVAQLINKEPHVGVTAFVANEFFDEGDIIFQKKMDVSYPVKIKDIVNQISTLYVRLALDICELILKAEPLPRRSQKQDQATYCVWRDEEDYLIDWHNSSDYIKRFIDAVGSPYKGAATFFDGNLIRILDAQTKPDINLVQRDVGKVIRLEDGSPVVVCGTGLLKITDARSNSGSSDILPLDRLRIKFKDANTI